jgi:hypothetical protein
MATELSYQDLSLILESLRYSKIKFETYEYPSIEIKQQRIKEVESIILKVQNLLKEKK